MANMFKNSCLFTDLVDTETWEKMICGAKCSTLFMCCERGEHLTYLASWHKGLQLKNVCRLAISFAAASFGTCKCALLVWFTFQQFAKTNDDWRHDHFLELQKYFNLLCNVELSGKLSNPWMYYSNWTCWIVFHLLPGTSSQTPTPTHLVMKLKAAQTCIIGCWFSVRPTLQASSDDVIKILA